MKRGFVVFLICLAPVLTFAEPGPWGQRQGFQDLRVQLEGTENRITVARQRYIKSVQEYNTTVRQFPVNLTAMVFGYRPKANFTVENEAAIAKPPTVDFGKPGAAGNQAPAPAGGQPGPSPKQ